MRKTKTDVDSSYCFWMGGDPIRPSAFSMVTTLSSAFAVLAGSPAGRAWMPAVS